VEEREEGELEHPDPWRNHREAVSLVTVLVPRGEWRKTAPPPETVR
jgi:hypothetical protein